MAHALSALLLLLAMAPAGGDAPSPKLAWDELRQLVGKRVSIPLYQGCAVSGKVTEVKPDALVVFVTRSSHLQSCPKGTLRIPRANLHVIELHKSGFKDKVLAPVGKSGGQQTTTIRIIP